MHEPLEHVEVGEGCLGREVVRLALQCQPQLHHLDGEDVAQVPEPSGNLHVLSARRTPPNPSEVLGSQRMRELLTGLREMAGVAMVGPLVLVFVAILLLIVAPIVMKVKSSGL